MSRILDNHLWPKGKSISEPDIVPSVLDSDGSPISYASLKRKTSEATVVDIGDGPNTNTGDPLRTAFIKINNFIEASYWTNEGINQDLIAVENRAAALEDRVDAFDVGLDGGSF